MDVQMAPRIAVHSVVELVRRKCLMYGSRRSGHVGKELVSLLVGDVDDFADVVLIGDYASALFGLLFEQYERRDLQVADVNAELI